MQVHTYICIHILLFRGTCAEAVLSAWLMCPGRYSTYLMYSTVRTEVSRARPVCGGAHVT